VGSGRIRIQRVQHLAPVLRVLLGHFDLQGRLDIGLRLQRCRVLRVQRDRAIETGERLSISPLRTEYESQVEIGLVSCKTIVFGCACRLSVATLGLSQSSLPG